MSDELSSRARLVAGLVAREFPDLEWSVRSGGGDDLEMFVEAPDGSAAGALVVLIQDGDLWVRFAPPQLWYLVDDEAELVSVVRGLVSGDLAFKRTSDSDGSWLSTTLVETRGIDRSELGPHDVVVGW
jgi:hypothetical protein